MGFNTLKSDFTMNWSTLLGFLVVDERDEIDLFLNSQALIARLPSFF